MINKNSPIIFILAGGSGTRLAPLSLTSPGKLPKQYLAIIGEKTMLQETIERAPEDLKKIIVGEEKYEEEAKKQAGDKAEIVAEPFGCNTAMAIGLAAIYAKYLTKDNDTVIFFNPSDHNMNKELFRRYLGIMIDNAKPGKIITMGITPDRPETGLGYIKIKTTPTSNVGEFPDIGCRGVYKIERFVEKPPLEKAIKYVKSGEYFWNSGMFCFTVGTIMDKLEKHAPIIYASLLKIEKDLGTEKEKETIRKEYQFVKDQKANISIDFAVMEKEAKNILLVKAEKELGWDDIGLWMALKKYFPEDENKNVLKGKASFKNCTSNLVLNYQKNQEVALENVNELLVVNTENGILICPQSSSIRAKEIVEGLEENQKEILIDCENIDIRNTTAISVACIDCYNLEVECNNETIIIKSSS
ncbi:MAG: sugar phosphate nucleotidyltransferase [Patescibacteria group bacterium]|nr:sugar phosphate nucleotidyltransferase [Patescibacteria group bacterium]